MHAFLALALLALAATTEAQTAVWYRRQTTTSPPMNRQWQLGYDSSRRVTVAFGWDTQTTETWQFDGVDWRRFAAATSPPPDSWNRFVEVTGVGLCLISNKAGRGTDIWRFDGQAWYLHSSVWVTASGRAAPAVAWDDRRSVLVMHGGYSAAGQMLGDTWEWDRTTWRQRITVGGPMPRYRHDMVFDAAHGEVVMLGGLGENGLRFTQTWLWNGSSWRFAVSAPSARYDPQLFFDSARGRVVLFGGMSDATELTDIQDWDGTAWLAHTPVLRPPSRGPIAFDSVRTVAVALVQSDVMGTWELAILPAVAGRWLPFGAACATSVGLPAFGAVTPSPYLGEAFETQVTNAPSHPLVTAIGMLGASRTLWNGVSLPVDLGFTGMVGCSLLVGPDVFLPLPRSGSTVSWRLPIPLDHALAGAPFFQQVIIGDPGINPLSLATTAGGDGMIGRR